MAIIKIKRGTKAAIEAVYAAKKLEYGELAVAIDTNKLYFTKEDQTGAILNPDGGTADSAAKLTVARAITLSGAVTGTVDFDGTADVTIDTVLKSVGTAGTYYKVTTDEKGRVTSGVTELTVEDLPEIPVAKITGLGDLAATDKATLETELDARYDEKYDAKGTAETKANEALESAKSYADTKIDAKISTVYRPAGSIASTGLVAVLLVAGNVGNVYNVTDAFVTDANFIEGAGHNYPAGTNVVVFNNGTEEAADYKFDVLAGFIDLSDYAKSADVTQEITKAVGDAKTELEGKITTVDGKVDDVSGKVTEVEGKVTTVENNLTSVTEKVTSITTALGGEAGTIPTDIVSEVRAGDGITVDDNKKTPTVSAKVDGTSIKVNADKALYVDVVDGGLLTE